MFLTGAQPPSSGQIGAAIRIGQTPHRNENCLPGLPADDADLDLVVAGESFLEGARWCWHIVAPALHSISPIHASKQFICRKVQPIDR